MSNLVETPGWDNVVQIETNTPALGGFGGPANLQAQALLNRTKYLSNQKANSADLAASTGAGLMGHSAQWSNAEPTTAAAKLRLSVCAFDVLSAAEIANVQGAGTTRLDAPLQILVDELAASGGGAIYCPPGIYRIKNLYMRDNIKLWGVPGTVLFKLPDGVDGQILGNVASVGGDGIDYLSLDGLIFDGNAANALRAVAASAVAINTLSYFSAKNCTFRNATGYGLGLQSVPGYLASGGDQTNIYLENCYFLDNGIGALPDGGDTYDGLDIKYCDRITLINCYAHRNVDKGINPRGRRITIIGGSCEDNGTGYECGANINTVPDVETSVSMFGCEASGNTFHGFAFNSGADDGGIVNIRSRYSLCGVRSVNNGSHGIYVAAISSAANMQISDSFACANGGSGLRVDSTAGAEADSVHVANSVFNSNGASGVQTILSPVRLVNCQMSLNSQFGFYETSTGSKSSIGAGCQLEGNVSGAVGTLSGALNKNLNVDSTATDNASTSVASAATITLPFNETYVVITGTTNITAITAGRIGQEVLLRFSGILTVTDGTNLIIAGNFVTSSNDMMKLVCGDGVNWFEVSRSVN